MSFTKIRKHKQPKKYNTKKLLKQIKGGVGPGSIFSYISNFIKLTKDTTEELNFIYQLKKELQDNNDQIKKDVDKYTTIYNKLFERTQGLYSTIDKLTDIQNQCSQLNPNQNTSSEPPFSVGDFFNKTNNTISDTITEETARLTNEGKQFATSIANQIPFTDASELQTKIEELKKEIISLNQEITQLKSNHDNEQNIMSTAFKNPVSDNELDNLDNSSYEFESTTPSEENKQSSLFEEQPMETQPMETQPMETQPMETQPMETQPMETQPMETESMETQPMVTQPMETQPMETQPMETQLMETQQNEEEQPSISDITNIPETDENKKQNAGKRRHYFSKKKKYKRINKSRNRKNVERIYL
jgi:prefoldin subunit 5